MAYSHNSKPMEKIVENDEDNKVIYQRAQSCLDPSLHQKHPSMTILTKSLDPSLLQRPPSLVTIRTNLKFLQRSQSVPTGNDIAPVSESIRSHSILHMEPSLGSKSDSVDVSQNDDEKENIDNKFSSSCIECVKPFRVVYRAELAVGDHIIHAGAVYDHHAIITKITSDENDENNMKKAKVVLIHATNNPIGVAVGLTKLVGGKANIRQTVECFDFEKCNIMVVKYFNAPFSASKIIRRAEEELKQQDFKYHLFGNNCEHFATYCVTNERFSVQVKKLSMTLQMFFSRGFVGLSDEKRRNQVANERNLICKFCFERNNQLFAADKKPLQKKSDVHKGDIITFSYWNLYHDAIVVEVHEDKVGNRNKVDLTFVHYAFCGPFSHRTILEERKTFPLDGSVIATIYKCPHFNVYSPEETIERAKMRIGEQQFAFFANDSSHFARWCKLKLSHSS